MILMNLHEDNLDSKVVSITYSPYDTSIRLESKL